MQVEQRIGCIGRFGQRHAVIRVANLGDRTLNVCIAALAGLP